MHQNSHINPAWVHAVPPQQMPQIPPMDQNTVRLLNTQIQQMQNLLHQNMMQTQRNIAPFEISSIMPGGVPAFPPPTQALQNNAVMTFPTPPPIFNKNTLPMATIINQNQQNVETKEKNFVGKVTHLHRTFGFIENQVYFQFSCVEGPLPSLNDNVYVKATFNSNTPFQWSATLVRLENLQKCHESGSTSQPMAMNVNVDCDDVSISGMSLSSEKDETEIFPTQFEHNVSSTHVDSRNTTVQGNRIPLTHRSSLIEPNKTSNESKRHHVNSRLPYKLHDPRPDRSSKRQHDRSSERRHGRLNERWRDRSTERPRSRSAERRRDRSVERPRSRSAERRRNRSSERRCDRSRERPRKKPQDQSRDKSKERPLKKLPENLHDKPKEAFEKPSYCTEPEMLCKKKSVPGFTLDIFNADVPTLQERFPDMHIPLDFFHAELEWVDTFPSESPFTLGNKSSSFHVMHKDIVSLIENDAVLNPPDANYSFSAKVMLISLPSLKEFYEQTCGYNNNNGQNFVHPTALIQFLVGLNGKKEVMAIGGPWSPSIDGPNPDKDPSVLIRTAIRTCKALTGINLSDCDVWYRFMELYYQREDSEVPEVVTILIPSVWKCTLKKYFYNNLRTAYLNLATEINQSQQHKTKNQPQTPTTKAPVKVFSGWKHASLINLDEMTTSQLKEQLFYRRQSVKGNKQVAYNRLKKCLEIEMRVNAKEAADHKKTGLQKERPKLSKARYTLPVEEHIIVHPSQDALSGEFDCSLKTLSSLLNYSSKDAGEHTFEVLLFAELFNEMLSRDFGLNIYKALLKIPKNVSYNQTTGELVDIKSKTAEEVVGTCTPIESNIQCDQVANIVDGSAPIRVEETSMAENLVSKINSKRVSQFECDDHLLLSFQYFDRDHSWMITEPDMKQLLSVLGLRLSQAQIKNMLANLLLDTGAGPALYYRVLITSSFVYEKPSGIVSHAKEKNFQLEITRLLAEVEGRNGRLVRRQASTNTEAKNVQPMSEVEFDELVYYKGRQYDMANVVEQLRFSLKSLDKMQKVLVKRKAATLENENNLGLNDEIERLAAELKKARNKLKDSETQTYAMKRTLANIRKMITPLMLDDSELNCDSAEKTESPIAMQLDSRNPVIAGEGSKSESIIVASEEVNDKDSTQKDAAIADLPLIKKEQIVNVTDDMSDQNSAEKDPVIID